MSPPKMLWARTNAIFDGVTRRPLLLAFFTILSVFSTLLSPFCWLFLILVLTLVRTKRSGIVVLITFVLGLAFLPSPPVLYLQPAKDIEGQVQIQAIPHSSATGFRVIGETNEGRVVLAFDQKVNYVPGDVLKISGELRPHSEGSGWREGTIGTVKVATGTVLWRAPSVFRLGIIFRDSFLSFTHRAIDPKSAAFLNALCIGETSELTSANWDSFRIAGITHIVSTSGLHATLAAGFLFLMLRLLPISRLWQLVLLAPFLLTYASAAGFESPIVRACLMVFVFGLAYAFRREPDGLSALSFAGIVNLIANPMEIGEIGFWLSFLAVGAIFVGLPNSKFEFGIQEIWKVNWRIFLVTTPLIGATFGQVSLLGLFVNLVVTPLASLLVIFTMISWMFFELFIPLGLGMGAILSAMTQGLLGFIHAVSMGEILNLQVPHLEGSVVVILTAFSLIWIATNSKMVLVRIFVVTGAISVVTVSIIGARLNSISPKVVFISVGQGDCILIQNQGRNIVIDSGGNMNGFDAGMRLVVPELKMYGVFDIDLLILSHSDNDHIGGASSLAKAFHVKKTLASPRTYRVLDESFDFPKLGRDMAEFERHFRLAELDVRVWPGVGESDNNQSLLVEVSLGEAVFVSSGDADITGESGFMRLGVRKASLLKGGHHGSESSTSTEWLNYHNPENVVFSCGRLNRFGHPSSGALERVRNQGATVWRTDFDGSVRFDIVDGSFRRAL